MRVHPLHLGDSARSTRSAPGPVAPSSSTPHWSSPPWVASSGGLEPPRDGPSTCEDAAKSTATWSSSEPSDAVVRRSAPLLFPPGNRCGTRDDDGGVLIPHPDRSKISSPE